MSDRVIPDLREAESPQVGDWIRFRCGGALLIGVIEYLRPRAAWDSTTVYVTNVGVVGRDEILELRRKQEPSS